MEESKPKNAEKNEAKRRAKLEKLQAKQAKQQVTTDSTKKKKPPVGTAAASVSIEEDLIEIIPGEKKDLSTAMASAYHPKIVEAGWYAWWEKKGYFSPKDEQKAGEKQPFVIVLPPPNITGALHIGHALTVAIQDSLIRWNRMQGIPALWLPGYDHAGISTQVVVQKKLWNERKITRHTLGREAFVAEVWKWKELYGHRIESQLRRLGGSYDWSRVKFTLDPPLCKAVNENFVRLHEEGIIYRSTRLVNWCVNLNTTLSNLEVENKELAGRTLMSVPGYPSEQKIEFGVLISFAYLVEGSDERIVVSTTRIETMLGDVAVAVHPDDERYKHLHGKTLLHPFIKDRQLKVITDAILVDPNFGTGAVKVTPAHDFNDYEVGKRHNLAFINILNDDGTLNQNAGDFQGMKRFDARSAVLEALKAKGFYVDTVSNPMVIPVCAKSGDVIEPLLKPQWWVRCKEMAQAAMDAVTNKELEILPSYAEKDWFRWLGNINDWCISRQLWWGHRVPAYFVKLESAKNEPSDGTFWVSGRTQAEAEEKAKAKFPGQKFTLEQDEDVLDTWFSSGLWPFSVFGWPDEESADFKRFYPNSVLETGWDILFFWVARMVMLGLKLTGKVPFKQVFCHAMVRDAHGRKMSKSLGNVVDPVDVIQGISLEQLNASLHGTNLDPREIEKAIAGQKKDFPLGIPECGTDALRFALCAYTSTGRDINLDILRVEGYRKFCNKLWNATRFALAKLDQSGLKQEDSFGSSLPERWILSRLNYAVVTMNQAFAQRNFTLATTTIYNFWLYELCDVFIELAKPLGEQPGFLKTLFTCLDYGLRLLHPLMPFVTEELYQRLHAGKADSISIAEYPLSTVWEDAEAEASFQVIFGVVKSIRSLTSDYGLSTKGGGSIWVINTDASQKVLLQKNSLVVQTLSKCKSLEFEGEVPVGCANSNFSLTCQIYLLVKGVVDIEGEVTKLESQLQRLRLQHNTLMEKTQVTGYEEKVRADVRQANSQKLQSLLLEIQTAERAVQQFNSLK